METKKDSPISRWFSTNGRWHLTEALFRMFHAAHGNPVKTRIWHPLDFSKGSWREEDMFTYEGDGAMPLETLGPEAREAWSKTTERLANVVIMIMEAKTASKNCIKLNELPRRKRQLIETILRADIDLHTDDANAIEKILTGKIRITL